MMGLIHKFLITIIIIPGIFYQMGTGGVNGRKSEIQAWEVF